MSTAGPTRQDPYRTLVQHTLPAEHFAAFQLAFLRPFAVPRMAAVLVRTGEVAQDAKLRAYRTGLQMYELIDAGLTGPRAEAVLDHINRAHAGRHIDPADFSYVLDSFVVVPIRHIDSFGRRRTTDAERAAAVAFHRSLGQRLGIDGLPATYAEIAARFDAYETSTVATSDDTLALGEHTITVLRDRLPAPLRRHAAAVFSAQLNDDRVAAALGLPAGDPRLRRVLALATRVHGVQTALRHRRRPFFTPGQPSRAFPDGYALADIL